MLSSAYGSEDLARKLAALTAVEQGELEQHVQAGLTARERTVWKASFNAGDPDDANIENIEPTLSHFCSVGDGQGDGSSDFFCFDALPITITINIFGPKHLPVVGVENFVKIGETGRIMFDLAFRRKLPNTGQWALDFDGLQNLYLGEENPVTLRLRIIDKNTGVVLYNTLDTTTNTGMNGMTSIIDIH